MNIKLSNKENNLKTIKELKAGESFGEIALIYNKPRLATIICLADSVLGIL